MLREVREETGLVLKKYQFRGIVTFVSDEWETEYMHLFTATEYEGTIGECAEGTLKWVLKEDVPGLNLWEGDKLFLKRLNESAQFFSLKVEYQGERLVRWQFWDR